MNSNGLKRLSELIQLPPLAGSFEDYGPLAPLIGTWEGAVGDDTAPGDDRGTEKNSFRERLTLEPIGRVDNHEQVLFGLKYSTIAWRLGEENPFHQEVGYWLWDQKEEQVMRSFIVPRGITVLAGGTAKSDANELRMRADLGNPIFGICSNPFLDREFKTVRYDLTIRISEDAMSFDYDEDTVIQMKGKTDFFHHRDKNQMRRVLGSPSI